MASGVLTPALGGRLMRIALGHVTREFPNKLDHVLGGPEDVAGPRALHPIFFGSFDWHSCVHGYWLLARLSHLFPTEPAAAEARALFAAMISPDNVAAECAYQARPHSRGFERPYGWAWLLMLAAELHCDPATQGLAAILQPLATAFAQRFIAHLPRATYPVRAGMHTNTAFALALAHDYAEAHGDTALRGALTAAAARWYGSDVDCTAWGEPSGEDFLSPTLVEAECMRRLLPPADFRTWLAAFLPRLAQGEPRGLLQPVTVSDRSDGRIAHLDGLNLSRAWCFGRLASALPPGDSRRAVLHAAAAQHRAASLPHVSGDYMGEHWLATFAVLALEAADA